MVVALLAGRGESWVDQRTRVGVVGAGIRALYVAYKRLGGSDSFSATGDGAPIEVGAHTSQ
jgi:hypothetical protein